jgi:hypothetical protein
MRRLLDNIGVIFLVSVIVVGLGWTLYDSLIKEEPVDTIYQSQVNACNRGVARSELDQRFALKASEARRRSAEKLADAGDKIGAENELATAREYEAIAEGYRKLTIPCNIAYPQP